MYDLLRVALPVVVLPIKQERKAVILVMVVPESQIPRMTAMVRITMVAMLNHVNNTAVITMVAEAGPCRLTSVLGPALRCICLYLKSSHSRIKGSSVEHRA